MTRSVIGAVVVATLVLATSPAQAQMQGQGVDMPNAREMSGMPLPAGDLAPGSVTVRVVRGSLANPLPKQKVEITGGATAAGDTNDSGRIEFTGLPVGAKIKAHVTVDGERLESQEFALPSAGGIRVMLVALDPEMAKREEEDRRLAAEPPKPGIVVFGNQSRFVFEIGEEGLNVFNIFEIQNTARTPVDPTVPIVFELPAGADHAAILEGSSPQASLAGKMLTVNGPFAPGVTLVQFAYTLHYSGSSVTFSQRLPAALAQVTVIAQKVGDLTISSPQIGQPRDMHAEGEHYWVAQGPPLAAGSDVTVAFSGLPGAPTWPKNLAVTLAVLILLAGAFVAFRGPAAIGADAERKRLEAERERLFQQLTALETSHHAGAIDPHSYASRRRSLVVSLERVYAALDEDVAA